MKNIDFTPIIEALIAFLSTIITLVVLPKVRQYLNEKLSSEQRENLKQWVKVAVAAAEQLYGSNTGIEKKEYVVSFLLSKGIVFDIDEVTAMIESEVYKIKQNDIFSQSEPEDDKDNNIDMFDMCADVPIEDETAPIKADEESQSDTAVAEDLFSARNTCE